MAIKYDKRSKSKGSSLGSGTKLAHGTEIPSRHLTSDHSRSLALESSELCCCCCCCCMDTLKSSRVSAISSARNNETDRSASLLYPTNQPTNQPTNRSIGRRIAKWSRNFVRIFRAKPWVPVSLLLSSNICLYLSVRIARQHPKTLFGQLAMCAQRSDTRASSLRRSLVMDDHETRDGSSTTSATRASEGSLMMQANFLCWLL